jgi:hypothetical protein
MHPIVLSIKSLSNPSIPNPGISTTGVSSLSIPSNSKVTQLSSHDCTQIIQGVSEIMLDTVMDGGEGKVIIQNKLSTNEVRNFGGNRGPYHSMGITSLGVHTKGL